MYIIDKILVSVITLLLFLYEINNKKSLNIIKYIILNINAKTHFFVSHFGKENTEHRIKSDSIFTQLKFISDQLKIPEDYIFKNSQDGIKFKIERSDHMPNVNILKTMLERLEQAHLVIVDITGLNPNVMYELGLRIGMEKPVIVIRDLSESNEDIPYNIKDVRIIFFDLSTEANIKKFQNELIDVLESFLEDQSIFIYKQSKLIYKIEHEDLDLLTEKKAKCKGPIKMSWIMKEWDSKNLFNYFNQEKEILEKNRIRANRLINTTNLDEETIIKHVMIYKTLIQNQQYRIYSTDREDYEIMIYRKIRSQINENVGFVLFPDSMQQENSLGLIIYDQNIINAIDNRYNNDVKNGMLLKINENDDDMTIKNTVISWIRESNKKFNGHI